MGASCRLGVSSSNRSHPGRELRGVIRKFSQRNYILAGSADTEAVAARRMDFMLVSLTCNVSILTSYRGCPIYALTAALKMPEVVW